VDPLCLLEKSGLGLPSPPPAIYSHFVAQALYQLTSNLYVDCDGRDKMVHLSERYPSGVAVGIGVDVGSGSGVAVGDGIGMGVGGSW
jgi:hypothetical protein